MTKLNQYILLLLLTICFFTPSAFAQTLISYSDNISGAISKAGEVDEYTFNGVKDEAITLRFAATQGNITLSVELFDEKGKRISSTDSGSMYVTLSSSGRFVFKIRDKNKSNTGEYNLVIQRLNNPIGAVNIDFGQTYTSSIESFSDINPYRLDANADDVIYIRYTKISQVTGEFNPFVVLYNAAGQELAEDSENGLLEYKVQDSGILYLYVMVSYRKGTGSCEFTVQRLNNPSGAKQLGFGQTITTTFSSLAEIDVYSFQMSLRDTVKINFKKLTQIQGEFIPYVAVYNSNGALVKESAEGLLTVPSSFGTFYILVMPSYRKGIGSYELTLQTSLNPQVEIIPVSIGEKISGQIDKPDKVVWYKFKAIAGSNFALYFSAEKFFYPTFTVYDSSGREMVYNERLFQTEINFITAVTDEYYLSVSYGLGVESGTYEFTLRQLNNPKDAIQLEFGQIISGIIEPYPKLTVYKFAVKKGDNILVIFQFLEKSSPFFKPYIMLLDTNGEEVWRRDRPSGVMDEGYAEEDGTFYLVIGNHDRNSTGIYDFVLQRTNIANATPLILGQTISRTFRGLLERDFYKFSAKAGDKLYFRFKMLNRGTAILYLVVLNERGYHVADSSSNTDSLVVNIEKEGNFYIMVGAAEEGILKKDRDMDITYELTSQRLNVPLNPKDIAYDEIVEDELQSVTGINCYKFVANANERIGVCTGIKNTTSGYFNLTLELYDSAGNLLTKAVPEIGAAVLGYTLTSPGVYYLFVTGSFSSGTGSYRFVLSRGNTPCDNLDFIEPKVNLISPKDGEIIENNSTFNIGWESSDNKGIISQEVRLSTDGGVTYATVLAAELKAKAKSYKWLIPVDFTQSSCRIKVIARDAQGNIGEDANKGNFVIINTTLPKDSSEVIYEYDKVNRLLKSTTTAKTIPGLTYSYDRVGNRLNLNVGQTSGNPPLNGTVNPNLIEARVGQVVNITTTYIDKDSWQDINYCMLMINDKPATQGAVYVYYDQNTNRVFLCNDVDNRWLGGFRPGSNNIIENSFVKMDVSKTAVSGNENTLTVNWNLTFKPGFQGDKNIYLAVIDDAHVLDKAAQKGIIKIK